MLFVSSMCSGQLFVTIEPQFAQTGLAFVKDDVYFYARVRYGHIQDCTAKAEYLKTAFGFSFKADEDTQILIGMNFNSIHKKKEQPAFEF